MNDQEHELAAAYALDAVDDLERAAFERHLRGCVSCQAEVASFRDMHFELAATAPPVPPPPSLKANLMAQVASTAQVDPAPAGSAARPESKQPGHGSARHASAARSAQRRSWSQRSRLLVAAAAIVVAGGGVGVGLARPWQQPTTVAQVAPVDVVLLASDARTVTTKIDGAEVAVTTSAQQRRAAIQTTDMPAAPSGHVYQAWFVDPAQAPRSAGIMSGAAPQLLQGDPGQVLSITVEPTGGSASPTTTPIVKIPLA